ncbi:MAG: DUF882 domain-containing protein [Xanthobacteraceae bacterium]
MPIGKARLSVCGFFAARAGYSCCVAVLVLLFASRTLQNAVAEGDTRTISMHHIHTDEDITITYKRDGVYDQAALEKLNWFLRDWRKSEKTAMDPHLIDLAWEVQREAGSKEPIWIVCGYRSPETNAMLRHRSTGVARFSQHMLGKAMDFYIPGVNLEHLREIGLRLARGGVGFYPTSGSPFVHMDTGNIRMWPRMSHEELARVFPDGKTVQIPSDGKPLPGYALALAEIKERGNSPSDSSVDTARHYGIDVGTAVASNEPSKNPFARLLGLKTKTHSDEDDDSDSAVAAADPAPSKTRKVVAAIERTAEKAAAATGRIAKAAEAKMVRTAALVHAVRADPPANPLPPDASGNVLIATTPNQIIASRGYWQGQPPNAQDAAASPLRGALQARTQVASADPNMTGSVNPLTTVNKDRAPSTLALGYAEQPQASPSDAVAAATSATGDQLIARNGMTTVAKDSIDPPHSSFQRAMQLATAAVKVGRVDSPWLRAIVLSPSVHHFMTTLALGARDLTSLAALMVKPSSSLLMTFSTDPTMGLPHDHFTRGTAIVFLPTVTYPTRTASLQ